MQIMKTTIILLSYFMLLTAVLCSPGPREKNLTFQDALVGSWKATAFDGELRESWKVGEDGWLWQEGYYIENTDTQYRAITKIEKTAYGYVLFSVIENSTPKIFQATGMQNEVLVFSNEDYTNPFEVKYEFRSDSTYRRSIKGRERDSLVTYVFDFKKVAD